MHHFGTMILVAYACLLIGSVVFVRNAAVDISGA
jgi:hypothetical protein